MPKAVTLAARGRVDVDAMTLDEQIELAEGGLKRLASILELGENRHALALFARAERLRQDLVETRGVRARAWSLARSEADERRSPKRLAKRAERASTSDPRRKIANRPVAQMSEPQRSRDAPSSPRDLEKQLEQISAGLRVVDLDKAAASRRESLQARRVAHRDHSEVFRQIEALTKSAEAAASAPSGSP
ncbi:MAG: hypothetical protein AAFW46_14725, partial [Pseudomonadota bacterium]